MARLRIDDAAWSSRWRRRSVTEKAVLSLGLLTVAMVARDWRVDLAVVVLALGLAVLAAGVPAGVALRVLVVPSGFVLIGLVGVLFSLGSPGPDAVWSAGPVWVDDSSAARGVEVLGRSFAALAAVMLLAMTTPVSDILAWLRRVGVPAAVVEVGALIYRMLFSLKDTLTSIREGQHARLGYADRRTALRSSGALFATVLHQSWLRAQRLEEGLAGRGYDGSLQVATRSAAPSTPFLLAGLGLVAALLGWAVVTR